MDAAIQHASAFCETCPCHGPLQLNYKGHVPISVVRREMGTDVKHTGLNCVNRGCRAPNLANSEINSLVEESFDACISNVAQKWRRRLSDAQWSELVLNFRRGKAHIIYVVVLKLSHWQVLPWFLCILGHLVEDIARGGAVRILSMFMACPEREANHRLTWKACDPNSVLGRQLREFAAEARRSSLPEFYVFCCSLAFVPVTERSIEKPHGDIKVEAAFKHTGPLCVTGTARLPEIDSMCEDEDKFKKHC